MEKIEVGTIEGYPVIYIPEKDLVFCKNTIVPFQTMKEVLASNNAKHRIEKSNLSITKRLDVIELGCLTTTIENINKIKKTIENV